MIPLWDTEKLTPVIHGLLPSGMTNSLRTWKWTIYSCSAIMKNGGSVHSYVNVYQRVITSKNWDTTGVYFGLFWRLWTTVLPVSIGCTSFSKLPCRIHHLPAQQWPHSMWISSSKPLRFHVEFSGVYTRVDKYFAMENGPFIVDWPNSYVSLPKDMIYPLTSYIWVNYRLVI